MSRSVLFIFRRGRPEPQGLKVGVTVRDLMAGWYGGAGLAPGGAADLRGAVTVRERSRRRAGGIARDTGSRMAGCA